MKIEVPQEQRTQIVKLYNQGHNRKQIKIELNLSFGDSVIKRILVEEGCTIRTNSGAQKGGRKKEEVNQEIQEKIIKLYNQGYGITYISKQINKDSNMTFSFDKVKRVLKDNNIKLRNYNEAIAVKPYEDIRKYKINDNYNLESHNGAWLLGFLAADGYLPDTNGAKNRITISLAEIDKEVLELIKKELEYEGPINEYESSSGYPFVSLSFTSKILREKIESYNIVNNKTFKLNYLPANLPEKYILDFIRGFFDGDGSIYAIEKEKKIGMSFTCASDIFLQEIAEYLSKEFKVSIPKINSSQRVHTIYDIRYYKKDSIILGDKFYNHNYLSLPRKQKKYFELVKNFHY